MIIPEVSELTRPFWEGTRVGELRLQSCAACSHLWHPPTPACPSCGSPDYHWRASCGLGHLYSYTIVEQAAHPDVEGWLPYAVVLVQLDEGPLFISNIRGCTNEELYIGMRVEACFEDLTPDLVLAHFKPTAAERERA